MRMSVLSFRFIFCPVERYVTGMPECHPGSWVVGTSVADKIMTILGLEVAVVTARARRSVFLYDQFLSLSNE